jgi:putative ABC transport system permease protein
MIGFYLQNALRGIRRSPTTSTVIVLSIALGIAVSMTVIAFYNGLQVDPLQHKQHLVKRVLLDNWKADEPFAEPDLAPPALTLQDARNLMERKQSGKHVAHYHSISHISLQTKDVLQRQKVSTRAATRDFFSVFEPEFQYGSGWDAQAETSRERVVVIARAINDRLFGGIDSTGQEIEVNGTPFRIVGVLDRWDVYPLYYDMTREDLVSDEVILPLEVAVNELELLPSFSASPVELPGSDFESRLASGEAVFVQYWIEFDNDDSADNYARYLDGYVAEQRALGRFPRLNNAADLIDIPAWISRQQEIGNQQIFMQTLVSVSLLFFLVCLLNIVTLLISRFMGNVKTVSITRALGAPKSSVFAEHLIEVSILGAIGGVIGLILARVGVTVLGPLFMGVDDGGTGATAASLDFSALIDSSTMLVGISIAIAGALLVALYPTWLVCRTNPSKYLKSL